MAKTSRLGSDINKRVSTAHNPSVGSPAPGMENQTWDSMVNQSKQNKILKDFDYDGMIDKSNHKLGT